jgi:hypothetical protein
LHLYIYSNTAQLIPHQTTPLYTTSGWRDWGLPEAPLPTARLLFQCQVFVDHVLIARSPSALTASTTLLQPPLRSRQRALLALLHGLGAFVTNIRFKQRACT